MKRSRKFRVIDGAKAAERATEPSEHRIQAALITYLSFAARPDVFYFAIPNQSNRHIANAVKMKAEGVRGGVADLCFMLPDGAVAWLEMKKKGGVLSDSQKKFRDACSALRHSYAVAYSIDEAISFLTVFGVLKPAYQRGDAFREAAKIHVNLKGAL